ncbi:MAG: ROK family transcriptional regulator [Spirochaetota bacterium]|nr:ROK family transcriptional regulator [Spirochaetota bacterium]
MKRTKIINRARIMREIWINREISRVEIARTLNLDKSTISNNVNELIQMGVVLESSEGEPGPLGGRKPVNIKLNKDYGCVLGLELRPDCYRAVAVDMEGEIIYSRFEKAKITRNSLVENFLHIAGILVAEIERQQVNLLGIGIGISGVVNAHEGIIRYSRPFEIEEHIEFYKAIEGKLEYPVFIDNDANACVWGELAFHRRKDLKDFIFLLLEFWDYDPESSKVCNRTGVGIGIVINGLVHYGYQYSAGEFQSVIRNEHSVGQFSLSEEEQMVVHEDEKVREKFIRELGANVALLVNTLNLSHVILGGYFEHYDHQIVRIFEEEIINNWPYPYTEDIKKEIWLSSFGDRAVAYGAAGMVLNSLFSDLEVMEGNSQILRMRKGLSVF